MEGGGSTSSWLDVTKTKLAVMSSLVGVGTIIYFTKNYLDSGRFVRWWPQPAGGTADGNTSRKPKVVGGKRTVVIKHETDVKGELKRKVMHRQRSRQSSVCSSARTARRGRASTRASTIDGNKSNRGSMILENIDINLNSAISELTCSVNEVQEILGLNDTNGSASSSADYKDCPPINGMASLMIEEEVDKLRKLIDFAQDINMVTDRTSDYVLKHQEVLEDVIPPPDYEPETYEAMAEDMFDDVSDFEYDSDNDSFISATESVELEFSDEEEYENAVAFSRKLKDLIAKHGKKDFYLQGIEFLTHYGVPVRAIRTEMLNCDNDVDFCVKVHCLRTAFADLLKKEENKKWFVEAGKEMLMTLLKNANHDYAQFGVDFDRIIDYCGDPDNWPDIDVELTGRGVCKLNFYDIVLDLLVMDSFQDLESPPSAVTSAINNKWLSTKIKYSALSTAIWAYIKAKKRTLENQEGFFSIFYDLSMTITPLLAWGFLGPVKELNSLCTKFKDSMVDFLRDIFSVESANYMSVQSLAEDVLLLAKRRKEELMAVLSR